MLNCRQVARPRREFSSISEVLVAFTDLSLNQEWDEQRDSHLAYEDAPRATGLKRKGERRDQTGGRARAYETWLISLGLILTQEAMRKMRSILAGEAIVNGDSPVEVLTNQTSRHQFLSALLIGWEIQVAERFKIRPFRLLLKLFNDDRA